MPHPNAQPWILGYGASHNGAVCLLHGDRIVAAVQEERLRGQKRARIGRLDESLAVRYCLDEAGIGLDDLDAIVGCYFSGAGTHGAALTRQGWRGQFLTIPHHFGHAVAAAVQSGFADSTIVVVDGQGGSVDGLPESETACLKEATVPGGNERNEIISLYAADASGVRCLEKHVGQWVTDSTRFGQEGGLAQFGSLGGMFSAASDFTFGNAMDAGKVMGLAAFGTPRFPRRDFFEIDDEGRFHFRDVLPRQLTQADRWPQQRELHQDLAASVQAALEYAMEHLVRRARGLNGSDNLCLVGGVALNNVANEKLIALPDFERTFIMPAAEDSGPAIGAAYWGLHMLGHPMPRRAIVQDSPGRRYRSQEIQSAIQATPFIEERTGVDVFDETVRMLIEGKILGWFQSGSELGPRALGQRSIIADPRPAQAKDRLNLKVKHREAFRPFAPAILEEHVGDWFQLPENDPTSPFMLRTFQFHPDKAAQVPAVVHQDGSGRLQTLTAERNGRFHELVWRFHAHTGVPILVNTSFNVMGEPIVETPEDALFGLLWTELDAVVLEDRLLVKVPGCDVLDLYPGIVARGLTIHWPVRGRMQSAINHDTVIEVSVEKRWGTARYTLPLVFLVLLSRIDGRHSGRQLLATDQGTDALPESKFREMLRFLRRADILQFRLKPWQPEREAVERLPPQA